MLQPYSVTAAPIRLPQTVPYTFSPNTLLPDCPATGIPGGAPTFSPDTTLSSSMTADLAGRSVNGATDNHRGSVLPAPAYAAYVFGACPAGRLPSLTRYPRRLTWIAAASPQHRE